MNPSALAKAEAVADAYLPKTSDSDKPIPDYSRLTYTEIALALKLREEGFTQVAIAERLQCSQPSLSELFSKFSDTRAIAKLRANNRALKLVDAALDGAERAAKDGKPEAALEVLDRVDVLAKRQVDSSRGSAVQVVVNMPGQHAITADMIDVSPAPFAPECPEIGQRK